MCCRWQHQVLMIFSIIIISILLRLHMLWRLLMFF